ncbi:MAG: phage head morphogenesis protein, partial [Pseudomonadaceae bacterium]
QAFTVAKATRLDILQDIREAVEKAITEGKTLAWFAKELTPVLQAKGWWGRQEHVDAETGEVTQVQLGSPWRLQTIYRTNLQTAYMAGRFQEQLANADDRPYWQYVAILDGRTRPSHRAMNGKVFRYDDPFWGSFYPPNGWGCRCRVVAL